MAHQFMHRIYPTSTERSNPVTMELSGKVHAKSRRHGGYLGFLILVDVPPQDVIQDALNQSSAICVVIVPTAIVFSAFSVAM